MTTHQQVLISIITENALTYGSELSEINSVTIVDIQWLSTFNSIHTDHLAIIEAQCFTTGRITITVCHWYTMKNPEIIDQLCII